MTACPACGGGDSRLAFAGLTDRLTDEPGAWDLRVCQGCGLGFLDPMVPIEEIGRYYQDNFPSHGVEPSAPGRLKRLVRAALLAPYTWRWGPPRAAPEPFGGGRMLDIGCGVGLTLRQFQARGWQVHGIDMSARAVAAARRNLPGATIEQAWIHEWAPPGPVDVITLFHVLEHVPEPYGLLAKCRQWLAPGGRLILEVPDRSGFEARLFGRYWYGLEVPRHYLHFSPASLRFTLERAGFRVAAMRPAFFCSTLSFSLLVLLRALTGRPIARDRLERLIYHALYLPASIAYACGNSGVTEAVAEPA